MKYLTEKKSDNRFITILFIYNRKIKKILVSINYNAYFCLIGSCFLGIITINPYKPLESFPVLCLQNSSAYYQGPIAIKWLFALMYLAVKMKPTVSVYKIFS